MLLAIYYLAFPKHPIEFFGWQYMNRSKGKIDDRGKQCDNPNRKMELGCRLTVSFSNANEIQYMTMFR